MTDMREVISAIEAVAKKYSDARLNLFRVEPAGLEGQVLRLQGQVLEEANLQAVAEEIQRRFPNLRIDTSAVLVGRKAAPRILSVGKNMTSMHNGTSFIAEQSTQMVNGTQVEVLWEQDRWAFVRQVDGYLGWTYLPYLSETHTPQPLTHIVLSPVALLRESPHADSPLVTRLLGGTYLSVTSVQGDWVWVELAGGLAGWLPVNDLRSLERFPKTGEATRSQIVEDSMRMIGVPYLWGGNTANGIDCSGLAQLLHRWVGITLPRDADMQCHAGKPVEPPFAAGDLLFFGEDGEQRSITHVGISLGGWRMIHSSRRQNGVYVDDVQQVESLRSIYLCAASYITE